MMFISPRNQKNFNSVAGTTVAKLFCLPWQNKPWPFGLRRKPWIKTLRRLTVAPLCSAHLNVLIHDFGQQQNLNNIGNRA